MSNPEKLVQILTMVAVFLVVIIFVLGMIWVFIILKGRKKEQNKDDLNENKENKKEKNVTYNMDSVFNFMDFEKIEDNMIIQKKGKFLMVIECQGINYDLMSDMERTSVEQGFLEFLNTLKSEIQIYVQTRTVNLEHSLQQYKLKFRNI